MWASSTSGTSSTAHYGGLTLRGVVVLSNPLDGSTAHLKLRGFSKFLSV